MTAPGIAQFVADRLDEIEATAKDVTGELAKVGYNPWLTFDLRATVGDVTTIRAVRIYDPATVLRQVAALRLIAGIHGVNHQCVPIPGLIGWTEQPCETLRALASMWAGHPDYDTTWEQT